MSEKSLKFILEMQPYINKDGFAAGGIVTGQGRTNDNSSMFTAEYLRILHDLDPTTEYRETGQTPNSMRLMQTSDGCLHRYPGELSPDLSPDNYLGFLNFCSLMNYGQLFAFSLRRYGWEHKGSYAAPWTRAGVLWRQPQLYYAVTVAAKAEHFWHYPLKLYTKLVVLAAAIFMAGSKTNLDNWRLSWHLLMIVDPGASWSVSRVWWNRLRKMFGDEGMRYVFSSYFNNPDHPFGKYAINQWEKNK